MNITGLLEQSRIVERQITEQVIRKEHLEKEKELKVRRIDRLNQTLEESLTASALLEKATQTARESGKALLEETVSHIVQMVFGEDYRVEIVLDVKRNTPVAEVFIKKRIGLNEELINVNNEGGGIRDIISLAFFVAICKLAGDDNGAIIAMDEPTPAVSQGHAKEVAEAIQALMDYLDRQSIIITHEREFLPRIIDRVYLVQQSADGVSKINRL